jgi:hypothetical protein
MLLQVGVAEEAYAVVFTVMDYPRRQVLHSPSCGEFEASLWPALD